MGSCVPLSDRRSPALVVLLGVVGGLGCTGHRPQIEPRYVAVHNALVAAGMAQSGPIERAELDEGADRRMVSHFEAGRCYALVALGSAGVRDLDVSVRDEGGDVVGKDTTHDREAAVRFCPERTGDYQVVLHMARGHGDLVFSSWSTRAGRAAEPSQAVAFGGEGAGTCRAPLPLELGQRVQGDTRRGRSLLSGSCGEGSAPEQIYRIDLQKRSQLSVRLQSGFDAVIYLLARCDDADSEVACNDDAERGQTGRSRLDVTLDAGTWFLVVDGYQDQAGDYEVTASASALAPIDRVCHDAPVLRPGQPVTGATTGLPDQFQASCAGGARSPDRVFRIDVPQRSRLRVRQQTDFDGALYLRSRCATASSELACDDDMMDPQHAVVHRVVDEGAQYVFVDGFSGRGQVSTGHFTVAAEIEPADGSGVSGDGCTDAQLAPIGQSFDLDTFAARDDLAGSCGGKGAPDVVYRIDVPKRSRLRAQMHASEFDGVMYLRDHCDDASSEEACVEVPAADPRDRVAAIDVVVAPGTHYLVVDGKDADAFGSARLQVDVSDLAGVERSCKSAPLLRPGHIERGTTAGHQDEFQATCAQAGGGPDAVYRLRVRRKSHVTLELTSQFDAILHVRRSCVDRKSEVGCNDDYGDNEHSRIEGNFEPGTYYVVVDGFRADQSGQFTLQTTVDPL